MADSNWQLIRSTTLRDFRVVRVREDTYQFAPSGDERGYVVCDSADWVLIIPITPDNEVVFVRQFRHGRGEVVLEIPGGVMDDGECPVDTAIRELREETGFVAEEIQICGPLLPNPALNNARIHVAVATGCLPKFAPAPEPFEEIEVELRPLGSVTQMIATGELQHALCIAAFAVTGVHTDITSK
jgi:8-oxo-dGTP pyrophosphatase MutT (NUDIX family)